MLHNIRVVTEQYERIEQKVIKIHGIGLTATLLIALVDLAHHRNALELIMLVDIGILEITRCRYQTVLCVRYAVLNYIWLVRLSIQLHLLND